MILRATETIAGRIRLGFIGLVAALAAAVAVPARAEITIDVTQGTVEPLPIAIPVFTGDEAGADIAGVVAADLKRSGLFNVLDPASFLERSVNPSVAPTFPNWTAINAQALVTGGISRAPDGRLQVDFRLWDVFAGQQLTGQQFFTTRENWRRVAHIIADAIYERLTGEKGYFDSRVVFVDETGGKGNRVKRLAIMDQDGFNVRYLTNGKDLVLTPRFSPSSQDITYMSFGAGDPRVYLLNIETGQREIVGNFPNMTFSPRFSPDGQRVVMSLEQDGNANIYAMDLRSRSTTRLTDAAAIDTSPSYSPDGSQIVFESDRGGNQQLYVMSAGGGGAKPHLLRPGPLFDPGLEPARRPHRLHQADGRPLRDRRHEAGRVGRAHPDGRLPQRRPDLGAQRPRPDVLPRFRRRGRRAAALDRRPHRPQRAARQDAVLRLRPRVVAASELIHGAGRP